MIMRYEIDDEDGTVRPARWDGEWVLYEDYLEEMVKNAVIADVLATEVEELQRENMTMRETLKYILSLDHKQWIKHECRLNYSASTVERDELLTVLRKCLWVLEAAVCSGDLYERAIQAARKALKEE